MSALLPKAAIPSRAGNVQKQTRHEGWTHALSGLYPQAQLLPSSPHFLLIGWSAACQCNIRRRTHENADAPCLSGLLGTGGERPGGDRNCNCFDEIASPHLASQALGPRLLASDYSRDLQPAKWGLGPVFRIAIRTPHVRFGSKADIGQRRADVRFTPNSGHQGAS
jgi:hypothetical protein